jgi:hypothetical protein
LFQLRLKAPQLGSAAETAAEAGRFGEALEEAAKRFIYPGDITGG